MKKKVLTLTAMVLTLALLASCAGPAAPVTPADAPDPGPAQAADPAPGGEDNQNQDTADNGEQNFRIAVSLPPIANDFHARMRIIINNAVDEILAEHPGWYFTVTNAIDDDDQLNQLDIFLNGNYDLIGIMPNNGTLLTPISEYIYNSGIPTVIMNRAIDSDVYTSFVTGDNFGGGYNAAHFIADFLGGEGDLVVLRSNAGSPIDIDRFNGFMEGIANYPGINILSEGDGQFNREAGFNAMSHILSAEAHIDAVFAQDDEAGLGAMTAIQAAGRDDIRIITGFGGTLSAFEIYQMDDPDQIFRATMSYFPTMGAEGIRQAVRILLGEPFERDIFQPSYVVTSENVHFFLDYAY